jgi:ActR/RegA family two-component response regulator
MSVEELLKNKLIPTTKKVVLIMEDDPDLANILGDTFHRRGFQVFIESSLDNARARLQILDATRSRVDLAITVDRAAVSSKSSAFVNYLNTRYDNIKMVSFAEHKRGEVSPAALMDKETNIEVIAEAADNSINYSQEYLKKHLEKLAEADRLARRTTKVHNHVNITQHSPEEIQEAEEVNKRIKERLASRFLEVMKAPTRLYRRALFKEYKSYAKMLRHELSFSSIFKMVRYYHRVKLKKKAA